MNKFIKYMLLAVAVFFASCKAQNFATDGEGTLSIVMHSDSTTNVTKASDIIYGVQIKDADGNTVKSWSNHTTIPSTIKLPIGTYTIEAASGEVSEAQFDKPIYSGFKEVTIKRDQTHNIAVVCTLANVKVTVGFSDVIKNNFSEYSLIITNNPENPTALNSITFTKDDIAKAAYLKAAEKLKWTLKLVNNQGDPYEISNIITEVKPRDHYIFAFDIQSDGGETDGSTILGLTIDRSLDVISHNYEINIKKGDKAIFVGDGFDIGNPVVVNELSRNAKAKVKISVPCGIQELTIRHYSSALHTLGIPRYFSPLVYSNPGEINAKGINWQSDMSNATSGWIDFTEFANTVPVGEYKFDITVYDAQKQQVISRLVVLVAPDSDHQPLSSDPWGKFATVKGQWNTLSVPSGLTFEYATQAMIDASTPWTKVPESGIVMGDGIDFSARITGLTPRTKYFYRTYSDEAGSGKVLLSFETEEAPEIPNLSFDDGYMDGKTWYINASGGNSFWATGNAGLTSVSKASNTVQVSGVDAYKGNAVRMTSQGGIPLVKHAAGNLFTGDFVMDIGNPKNSPKFGRPYSGRPLGLKGWYKYKSTPITVNAGKPGSGDDMCHIYISLEDWGGATARPSNPTVIGYGEFKSALTVTDYTPFHFEMTYNNLNTKPTHIVFTATSSVYGGDFCGGAGSELCVDEFELIWE